MMSSKQTSKASRKTHGTLEKLPCIAKGARIEKRPLIRRQPPASSKSRIIYVSSKTPFMSAVKRARKQLDASLRTASAAPKHASVHSRIEALKRAGGGSDADGAEVKVMGTGRAVEKTLAVAGWFEQEGDCEVEVRTGTVGTVDDVVEGDEEDESRLRKLSYLEVSIKLK